MASNDLDFALRKQLLPCAPCSVLSDITTQLLNGDSEYAREWMDDIMAIPLSQEQNQAIADVLEQHLFCHSSFVLLPYLACLYERLGNSSLARYYMEQCRVQKLTDIGSKTMSILDQLERRFAENMAVPRIKTDIWNYNADRNYTFNNVTKQYSVRSFSKTIGRNMTLLKTPYGSVLFDCGAEATADHAKTISAAELRSFLDCNHVSISDIIAVFISHAHLDHYGSLGTLFQVGIPVSRVYANLNTEKLIYAVSQDTPHILDLCPSKFFSDPAGNLKVIPVPNGHILGSECYIVSFDCINVLYTGDFCLHNQHTVPGLNLQSIKSIPSVAQYGIDCLITESTYAKHNSLLSYEDSAIAFNHLVSLSIKNHHKVFIPSFAVGRSQEVILSLNADYRILVDGLAVKLSKIYQDVSHVSIFNANTRFGIKDGDKESNFTANDIVVASSGMLVKNSTSANYMETVLDSSQSIAVIKTGYISSEAYGNILLDRWKDSLHVFFDVPLSAHADRREIYTLISTLAPRITVAVHGNGIDEADAHPCSNNNLRSNDSAEASAVSSIPQSKNTNEPEADNSLYATLTPDIRMALSQIKERFGSESDVSNSVLLSSPEFRQLFLALGVYPRHHRYLEAIQDAVRHNQSLFSVIKQLFAVQSESFTKIADDSSASVQDSIIPVRTAPTQNKFTPNSLALAKRISVLGQAIGRHSVMRLAQSPIFQQTYRSFLESISSEHMELATELSSLGDDYASILSVIKQHIPETEKRGGNP